MNDEQNAKLAMRVMSAVWALVRSGPNFDGRHREVEDAILAALDAAVAAERERWTEATMRELDSNGQAHEACTLDQTNAA